MNLTVTSEWGRLEALLDVPAAPARAVVVLASAGLADGSMRSRVLHEAARGFVEAGVATLRFNFPGVGLTTKTSGQTDHEIAAFRLAVDEVTARFPDLAVWAAGYDHGAWVAGMAAATDGRISSWIAIAPHVERDDFTCVLGSTKAKFILHAEQDVRVPLKAVHRLYARLDEPRELVVIESAGHTFDGSASHLGDTIAGLFAGHEHDAPLRGLDRMGAES